MYLCFTWFGESLTSTCEDILRLGAVWFPGYVGRCVCLSNLCKLEHKVCQQQTAGKVAVGLLCTAVQALS